MPVEHAPRSNASHRDWEGPYVLSIEETHGKVKQHGFHLGTDLALAKQIAAEMFHARIDHGQPVITIALLHNGRIVDVYDGGWSSEREWD